MRILYSPEAREDLNEIKRFISTEYHNPQAAKRIVQQIMQSCSNLRQFPQLGMRLSEKLQRETPLRFLISGNHIAFYRIEGSDIRVTRILDGRTSYLRVLFGEAEEGDSAL